MTQGKGGDFMGYKGLREWLEEVAKMGELRVIKGADWNLEIGAIQRIGG